MKSCSFRNVKNHFSRMLLAISILLCIFLFTCYAYRFDTCAAITAFPAWSWIIPGFILTAFGSIKVKKRIPAIIFSLWIIVIIFLADETKSIIRTPLRPKYEEDMIRIISLNCGGGNYDAAKEISPYNPDIVLLQETPTKNQTETLTKYLFGTEGNFVWEIDTSIITNGKIISSNAPDDLRLFTAHARVRFKSGLEVKLISLRLAPPPMLFDLWSSDCWKTYSSDRQSKCNQVSAIRTALDSLPLDFPVIAGGDFNVPAGDGSLSALEHRLHDTFLEGGRGWGNTVTNDIPVHRFDQVWASNHFKAIDVVAKKTEHSDHRMVIADLRVQRQ